MRFVTSYLVIEVGVLTERWSALAAAAPSQDELSTIAIFREMSRGVVHVTAMSARQAEPDGEGGARRRWYRLCFFDHPGHLLTVYHVVKGHQKILAILATGEEFVASVVGRSDEFDVALLRIEAPRTLLFPLTLGESTRRAEGDGHRQRLRSAQLVVGRRHQCARQNPARRGDRPSGRVHPDERGHQSG